MLCAREQSFSSSHPNKIASKLIPFPKDEHIKSYRREGKRRDTRIISLCSDFTEKSIILHLLYTHNFIFVIYHEKIEIVVVINKTKLCLVLPVLKSDTVLDDAPSKRRDDFLPRDDPETTEYFIIHTFSRCIARGSTTVTHVCIYEIGRSRLRIMNFTP